MESDDHPFMFWELGDPPQQPSPFEPCLVQHRGWLGAIDQRALFSGATVAVLPDDPPQPGRERGWLSKLMKMQENIDESVLCDILGDVSHPAESVRNGHALKPRDEPREGCPISSLRRYDIAYHGSNPIDP